MNKRARQQSLQKDRLRPAVILREAVNEADDRRLRGSLAEHLLHRLGNHPVRETQNDALVHRPGSKVMPEQLSAKLLDGRRVVGLVASSAIALLPYILDYC